MTPLFGDDGNVNREGKRIRVTVEEAAGKYELFSREESGKTRLYFLTASGRIDGTSTYIPDIYDVAIMQTTDPPKRRWMRR